MPMSTEQPYISTQRAVSQLHCLRSQREATGVVEAGEGEGQDQFAHDLIHLFKL
jgi:hypothetical protein